MSRTKTISEKQAAIDKGWALYNAAMEAAEELGSYLDELESDHEVDVSKASKAAYEAHSALEEPYSTGRPILPAASSDGGKA